ncbi:MAG: Ig-like domain-containing protein [Planctomycetes bacterium]|nr:Ig-like domain-containing protein [Planctomycetota bacterium]
MIYKLLLSICVLCLLCVITLPSVEEIDAETFLPSVTTANGTVEVVGQLGGAADLVVDATPTYVASEFAGLISNQMPILGSPGSFNVTAGSSVNIGISSSAADLDGDVLSWVISSGVSQGTMSGSAGTYVYTPTVGYVGPDAFTISVNDGADSSVSIMVSINVLAGSGTGRTIVLTVNPDPGAADMLNITTSTTVIHNGSSGATSSGNDKTQSHSFIFILASGG